MKKLRSCKAFSLAETLCVVVVVVIMAAMLTSGIQLAAESYSDSVMRSESAVLASTLTTVITDELRYAGSTTVSGSTITAIFSQKYGSLSGGFSVVDGHVYLGGKKLLSDSAYTNGQKVGTIEVNYDTAAELFKVEFTLVSGDGSDSLCTKNFSVKPLNAVVK